MKTRVVKIGNSQGIRIPKPLLEQTGLEGEVYLVNLDPTVGSEIKKTRPCLVVSPDEMNHHIRTVLVAPMTTKGRANWPVSGADSRASKAKSCSNSSKPLTRRVWSSALADFEVTPPIKY